MTHRKPVILGSPVFRIWVTTSLPPSGHADRRQASQEGYRIKRVGFVATFRLAGAGKSTLKVLVSSWGYEYTHMPGVRASDDQVWGTQRQGRSDGAAPCAISARSATLIPRPSILMSSWRGCWVGVVRWICLAGAARFVGVVSRCGSYGLLTRSSMRFMRSSSSMVSTWAEVPWSSSPKHPIVCWVGTRPGVRILRPGKRSRQRTVTKHNPKEQQPSTTPTDSEAGAPQWATPASSFKR